MVILCRTILLLVISFGTIPFFHSIPMSHTTSYYPLMWLMSLITFDNQGPINNWSLVRLRVDIISLVVRRSAPDLWREASCIPTEFRSRSWPLTASSSSAKHRKLQRNSESKKPLDTWLEWIWHTNHLMPCNRDMCIYSVHRIEKKPGMELNNWLLCNQQ